MLNNSKLQTFLAIGPLAFLFLSLACYFVFLFTMIPNLEQMENTEQTPVAFLSGMGIFVILIIIAIFLSMFSWIYFLIHAAKNPNLENENNMKIVWILIIVLVSGIGQLIYWIAEIKTKNPKPIIPN